MGRLTQADFSRQPVMNPIEINTIDYIETKTGKISGIKQALGDAQSVSRTSSTALMFGRESVDFQYSESVVQSRLQVRDAGNVTPSSIDFKLTSKGDLSSSPFSKNQQSGSAHKQDSFIPYSTDQRTKPVSEFNSSQFESTALKIERQQNVLWAVKPLEFDEEPNQLRQ